MDDTDSPITFRGTHPEYGIAVASRLRAELPEAVPLIAGGQSGVLNAALLESSRAIVIPDVDAWEKCLDAIRDEAKIPESL